MKMLAALLTAALAGVQEREEMVRYVTEEVDRVKSLFQEKEGRLASERDGAKEASQAATRECQVLQEQLSTAQTKLATLAAEVEVRRALGILQSRALTVVGTSSVYSSFGVRPPDAASIEICILLKFNIYVYVCVDIYMYVYVSQ